MLLLKSTDCLLSLWLKTLHQYGIVMGHMGFSRKIIIISLNFSHLLTKDNHCGIEDVIYRQEKFLLGILYYYYTEIIIPLDLTLYRYAICRMEHVVPDILLLTKNRELYLIIHSVLFNITANSLHSISPE